MSDEENPKEYRWEAGYEKTWEALAFADIEDEDGNLVPNIAELMRNSRIKRTKKQETQNRLGLMRKLFILIDFSEAMSIADFKPSRLHATIKHLKTFVHEFVTLNPISQMGIIGLTGKRAEILSKLTGNYKQHLEALKKWEDISLANEISLANGFELAMKSFEGTATHVSSEILVIMASLGTCDAIDMGETIEQLVKRGIRVSVISLSAEVYVCRKVAETTNGEFNSVLNEDHFRATLMEFLDPPASIIHQESALVRMGFPHDIKTGNSKKLLPSLSLCWCHGTKSNALLNGGYQCPQCMSKCCELPTECATCGLLLVTASHLTRSYHHLFPVKNFTELEYNGQAGVCFACQQELSMESDKYVYRCELCKQIYCYICDVFIHDTLHSCVGCNM